MQWDLHRATLESSFQGSGGLSQPYYHRLSHVVWRGNTAWRGGTAVPHPRGSRPLACRGGGRGAGFACGQAFPWACAHKRVWLARRRWAGRSALRGRASGARRRWARSPRAAPRFSWATFLTRLTTARCEYTSCRLPSPPARTPVTVGPIARGRSTRNGSAHGGRELDVR